MGGLPCYADVIKWWRETGKVWACHSNPSRPCVGFLQLDKEKGLVVNRNTVLITEGFTLEQIYDVVE